jgi:Flp pilus assembly pilin Flp
MRQQEQKRAARQRGGAALEYVLVSTFAAALCIAALTFVGNAVHDKLEALGDKLGSDAVPDDLDWLGDGP